MADGSGGPSIWRQITGMDDRDLVVDGKRLSEPRTKIISDGTDILDDEIRDDVRDRVRKGTGVKLVRGKRGRFI